MASNGISISGLVSGIQWRDMVDQIMTMEKARQLDPINAQKTKDQARLAAWKSYGDVVAKLRDAAAALQKGTPFNAFSATASKSPTTNTALLSATASSGAIPATYKVEVQDIARAEKLGASAVADVNAAMNLSGEAMIGGKKLSIVASDTLANIRDKINALNTGTNASRVSATIITVSSGVNRLVLTSDTGGSAGIELVDNGGSNVLSSLGVISGTLVANTVGGATRSYGFDTPSTPIGQALATTMPAAGSFKVNGVRVDVDLSQDSLTAIANKINAAAGANTASVQTEVVNGRTVSRLMVNGTVTPDGDDGPAAQAVSTQNLQQLGFLKNQRAAGMQLVTPSDAVVKIDGISVTRSTNVISDALAGVTLTLQAAEVGTTVDVTVARDTSAAVNAVKDFATAYNTASAYVATNTAEKGPLAFDTGIRATLRHLRSAMLESVVGLQNANYTTGTSVGVSLDKTGKMVVDEAALKAALASSPGDVRELFATSGRSTVSTVQYMGASTATQPGSYAVSITQAATMPVATSDPLVGAYGNAAVANTMKVTDAFSGKTISIALADDDTASTIAAKLNIKFGENASFLGASVTNAGELQITGTQYGSGAKFTVGFALDGVEAEPQLGFETGAYAGLDVAGTINGKAASGTGRLLTAPAPAAGDTNAAEGLSILYTGTTTADATVTYVLGLGGMMFNRADPMMRPGDGQIQGHQNVIQNAIDSASKRAEVVQTRLDQQRESLMRRFTAMETALSKLQAQGNALLNQINSLQQSSR